MRLAIQIDQPGVTNPVCVVNQNDKISKLKILRLSFLSYRSKTKRVELDEYFNFESENQLKKLDNLITYKQYNQNCTFSNCWEVLNCTQFTVYIEEPVTIVQNGKVVSPRESVEFYEFRNWLKKSKYYTDNQDTACVKIPMFDMLSHDQRRWIHWSITVYCILYTISVYPTTGTKTKN